MRPVIIYVLSKTQNVGYRWWESLLLRHTHRRGSRINTDRFPTSREDCGHAPPGNVFDFNSPKSPFLGFWVIQTGYLLTVQTIFKISTWNLTDFRKTVKTGMDPRQTHRWSIDSSGNIFCVFISQCEVTKALSFTVAKWLTLAIYKFMSSTFLAIGPGGEISSLSDIRVHSGTVS